MIIRNDHPTVSFFLTGPKIYMQPADVAEIKDKYRQNDDIDSLIQKGYLAVISYSNSPTSTVVQEEIGSGPPTTTDEIVNTSTVPGITATDALQWLQSESLKFYKTVLTSTDITNKFISLPSVPSNLNKVMFRISGGPTQIAGFDFNVLPNGNIDWNATDLATVLSSGDKLDVYYM